MKNKMDTKTNFTLGYITTIWIYLFSNILQSILDISLIQGLSSNGYLILLIAVIFLPIIFLSESYKIFSKYGIKKVLLFLIFTLFIYGALNYLNGKIVNAISIPFSEYICLTNWGRYTDSITILLFLVLHLYRGKVLKEES